MFEVGKRYPMDQSMANEIIRCMGIMAGPPDLSRGRRYTCAKPDGWEFWLKSGKKVTISVSITGDIHSDHFIASISQEVDPDLPEPL